VVASRYTIDDLIGSGGMSIVYRAHDKKLDRYITLKILREEYLSDESLISRFPIEARAAAGLNHQNVVKIFDYGHDDDIYYISLEYVDGSSLKEIIKRDAPFDSKIALGVGIQIADGLAEAHRNQIVHLDVKPQNILVTKSNIVKVTDFGIARVPKVDTLTAGPGSMGSVHYFSPEQARGGYVDHKSDIYSLGIVLYELVTGQLPFDGDIDVAIAMQHIEKPLPNVLEINPDVTESVIRIINKATAKSPSQRYATISDMAKDMKKALTDPSGNFVVTIEPEDELPTRNISKINQEEIRRKKARKAFLDTPPPKKVNNKKNIPIQETDYDDDFDNNEDDDYYDDDEPIMVNTKKSDRIAIFAGVLLALFMVIPITMGAFWLYRRLATSEDVISPPMVEGLEFNYASNIARNHFLVLYIYEREYSDEHDEGYIIRQFQPPDYTLSRGDRLQVVVSRGPEPVQIFMPNVTNITLDEAEAILNEFPVSVTINFDFNNNNGDEIPPNMVLEQTPTADTVLLGAATLVQLLVSAGPMGDYVIVPSLSGLTEQEALLLLREIDLVGLVIERREHASYEEGFVFNQDPVAGETVRRDSLVRYRVSLGEPSPTPPPTPSPSPTPTPTPSPVPTPTPTPTPSPTPPPQALNDSEGSEDFDATVPSLPIEPISTVIILERPLWFTDDMDVIHLRVLQQRADGTEQLIVNDPNVTADRFPFPLQVTGNGLNIFHIYSGENPNLRSQTSLDFDAVN